ncbi:GerMN domain-containing protein [Priestia endophytica]|uniref:GerMN domain-containing protein n=1 Tax=Priestia endophytica TaxID=135735 RepID=UPI000DCA81AD|nr:GerMN domain-containing protein [Priestia endophytica]RAS82421.1 sporulation protein [Priestia endophytica]
MSKIKITAVSTMLATSMLLTGCGLFGGEDVAEEIDPPQDVEYTKDNQKIKEEGKETTKEEKSKKAEKTLTREVYLIDKNGFVVPQTIDVPKADAAAAEIIEYLVVGGPIDQMLPNGFRAVLPAGTEVKSVNLKENGTLVVDFSPEFKEYKAEDESRILQSLTWTLTQFDAVKNVQLQINGYDQKEMPVNKTPISEELTRADGINMQTEGITDMTSTSSATLYYLSQNADGTYYVPVTKRLDLGKTDEERFTAVVDSLINEVPKGLVGDFNNEAALVAKPEYEDGTVTLTFNKALLNSAEKSQLSKHVVDALALSLTEQKGVENVSIEVKGQKNITVDSGQKLTEEVSRPENINAEAF